MDPTTRQILKFGSFAVGGAAALTLVSLHSTVWVAIGVFIAVLIMIFPSFLENEALPGLVVLAVIWALTLLLGV